MIRMSLLIHNNHEIPSRRDKNELGMRHDVTLSTGYADFVWLKGDCAIEFADGFNEHDNMLSRRVD